ncbi:MAG: glycosyltransferase family A protein [Candidatus Daviesbacteria bacterium]|nr:glycosyltransferase family A protein [Candidatus Daviesbacteria bacterium]
MKNRLHPKSLKEYDKNKIFNINIPNASFLFVTHNRCPNSDFTQNPLTWAFETLLANHLSSKITEWLVISDGSSDFTKENIDWLAKRNIINIKAIYHSTKKGCSYRRREGIGLLNNDLFFMGDDDCLFRKDFIGGSLSTWLNLANCDNRISVLALPVLEMRTSFKGRIDRSKVGKIEYEQAWFYHNFDKKVYDGKIIISDPFPIQTFTGVSLNSKKAFLSAGNFLDLSYWSNDYSEHLEISRSLALSGYSMYYLPNIFISATHIQWGSNRKVLPENEKQLMFEGVEITLNQIEKASWQSSLSGCRVPSKDFVINRVGNFLSFYLKVNPKYAHTYAVREFECIINNKSTLGIPSEIFCLPIEQRIYLWKEGIRRGLENTEQITGVSYHDWYINLMNTIP